MDGVFQWNQGDRIADAAVRFSGILDDETEDPVPEHITGDLYSRRVVGWSMGTSLATELVLQAFLMAVTRRQPPKGLLFHSDRGVQYASHDFRRTLKAYEMLQSMSRKGECWDNACAETFFKTLKTELIGQRIYRIRREAKAAIFEYIEVFHNRVRLHSYLGYTTPTEYEEGSHRWSAA